MKAASSINIDREVSDASRLGGTERIFVDWGGGSLFVGLGSGSCAVIVLASMGSTAHYMNIGHSTQAVTASRASSFATRSVAAPVLAWEHCSSPRWELCNVDCAARAGYRYCRQHCWSAVVRKSLLLHYPAEKPTQQKNRPSTTSQVREEHPGLHMKGL